MRHVKTAAEREQLEAMHDTERYKMKCLVNSAREQADILKWEAARLHGLTDF